MRLRPFIAIAGATTLVLGLNLSSSRLSTSKVITVRPATDVAPETPAEPVTVRMIRFPVIGDVEFHDDFGDCRDACSRYHEGTDLIGEKMQPEIAAVDGTITTVFDDTGKHGIGVTVTDAEGWTYTYFHVNNDVPGDVPTDSTDTAEAAKARWHMPSTTAVGATVTAGQVIAWMGNSGNAEHSVPHLHFEIRDPNGVPVDPYASLVTAQWRDRCHAIVVPFTYTAPVLSPPEVVADTVFTFPTASGAGSFTISSAGGVALAGDASLIGWHAGATPSCDGPGPEPTGRTLPGTGENLGSDSVPVIPIETGPEPGAPDPDEVPGPKPAPAGTTPPATSEAPATTAAATAVDTNAN
jgi:hypothetical protein